MLDPRGIDDSIEWRPMMIAIGGFVRAGVLLAALSTIFASTPPAYGQVGTVPRDAEGINQNYDLLKEQVAKTEQSLKDAIAEGNVAKANDMRRNLQFYGKRLAALEKAATGKAVRAKDSQIVEKITELKNRVTKILDDPKNKVAQPATTGTKAAVKSSVRAKRPARGPSQPVSPQDRSLGQGGG